MFADAEDAYRPGGACASYAWAMATCGAANNAMPGTITARINRAYTPPEIKIVIERLHTLESQPYAAASALRIGTR